jgi:hypothetical protein
MAKALVQPQLPGFIDPKTAVIDVHAVPVVENPQGVKSRQKPQPKTTATNVDAVPVENPLPNSSAIVPVPLKSGPNPHNVWNKLGAQLDIQWRKLQRTKAGKQATTAFNNVANFAPVQKVAGTTTVLVNNAAQTKFGQNVVHTAETVGRTLHNTGNIGHNLQTMAIPHRFGHWAQSHNPFARRQ